MKIEAVEAANNPKGMANAGEKSGRFWGSGKGLSGFGNMPENFAFQPALLDGAKVAAVRALWMRADDKDFISLEVNILDLFDHCTVNRMLKDNYISRFEPRNSVRVGNDKNVIALVIFGGQAFAADFENFEHRKPQRLKLIPTSVKISLNKTGDQL